MAVPLCGVWARCQGDRGAMLLMWMSVAVDLPRMLGPYEGQGKGQGAGQHHGQSLPLIGHNCQYIDYIVMVCLSHLYIY